MKAPPIANLRSKSWEEFAKHDCTALDHVITVCNNAAGETCPYFPAGAKLHWDIPDPAAATGTPQEVEAASGRAYDMLKERITALIEQK